MRLRIVFCLALSLLPGCAYLSNRARDAGHCVLADAKLGVGVTADAKVGPLALGVGLHGAPFALGKTTWWSGVGLFRDFSMGVPLPLLMVLTGDTGHAGIVAGMLTQLIAKEWQSGSNTEFFTRPTYQREAWLGIVSRSVEGEGEKLTDTQSLSDRLGGIEAGAFAGIAGARVGFNLAEFGDFVLGWFGLDILEDDIRREETEQPPADVPTSAPEKTEERERP